MQPTTQDAFAQALISMLEEKTLDHITVKDLSEKCGVTRQAFYYHFEDIFALVEWIYLREAEKALAGNKDYDTWQQGFYQILYAIRNNKALVQNTYRSLSRDSLERYMYNVLYDLILAVVERQAVGMDVEQEHKDFIARFYSLAFIAVALEWIRDGMKEKPQDVVDQIAVLIKGDFEKALKKYTK
jgi:probable dihydroxyacetone kinase regulator